MPRQSHGPVRQRGRIVTRERVRSVSTTPYLGMIADAGAVGTLSEIGCVPGPASERGATRDTPVHDKTVCIIDDELAMRESLESLVRSMGVRVRLYASAEAFRTRASGSSHCIVCDIQMAGMSGIELLAAARRCCDVPIIFVTAHPSARRLLEAGRLGALCVLEKPFDPRELVRWVMQALAGC